MRIDEFASAEEQMALWKLVNDNVWQAIETQRQQQAQAAQAKAAKAKSKPRKGRKGGRGKLSIPMPPPPPSPKKAPPARKPEASAAKSQNLQPPAQGQQMAQRQPLAQPHTSAAPIAPANASTAPKDGVFAQKLVQKNSEVHEDDRHSKNGYPLNLVHKVKPLGAMPRHQ